VKAYTVEYAKKYKTGEFRYWAIGFRHHFADVSKVIMDRLANAGKTITDNHIGVLPVKLYQGDKYGRTEKKRFIAFCGKRACKNT
jgi:hypothetical protein